MSFGLTNTLIIFLDLMNNIFKKYLNKFMIVIINNILIYSQEKLAKLLKITFSILKEK